MTDEVHSSAWEWDEWEWGRFNLEVLDPYSGDRTSSVISSR